MNSRHNRRSPWQRLFHVICLTLSVTMILSSFGLTTAALAQMAPTGSTGSTGSTSPTGPTGSTSPSPSPTGSTGSTPAPTPAPTGSTGSSTPAPTGPTGSPTPTPPPTTPPTISSDQADYPPGAQVTLTGTNWQPGELVHIDVNDDIGRTWEHTADVTADPSGTITDIFTLPDRFIAQYSVVANGPISGTATTSFTDASSADLDQCGNGTFAVPVSCSAGAGWQNGNLNANQAHYREGDSVPYRMKLSSLSTGVVIGSLNAAITTTSATTISVNETDVPPPTPFTILIDSEQMTVTARSGAANPRTYTVVRGVNATTAATHVVNRPVTAVGYHLLTIGWDTLASSKHAIDYLTSFNRTETTADPCSGPIAGCSTANLFPIPTDGSLPFTQVAGNFACFSCTITSTSAYTFPTASTAQITIRLTTASATPVVAWGGHIANEIDWGQGNAAGNISGSSYHTRLVDMDGGGGNQDRGLSAAAVPPPPAITTQVSDTTISLGSSVTDSTSLTGGASPLAGTVNFFVCGPSGSPPDCSSAGSGVGTTKTLSPGTGTTGTATSDAFTALVAGTYCFRVEYTPTGSSPNSPGEHTNTSTTNPNAECFIVNAPGLTVTKSRDAATVNAGTGIGYTITVSNAGPGNATGVTLSDTLPTNTGLTWSVGTQTGWSGACTISSGTLTCPSTSIASGGSTTVHITSPTTFATCPSVSNLASFNSTNGGTGNSGNVVITVNCPSLTISKTADASPVSPGTTIGYTITVSNAGPGNATGVTLSDTLPTNPGLNWSVGTQTGWSGTCTISSGILTCPSTSIASGGSTTVHITSPTTSATCGTVSNTASFASTNHPSGSSGPISITVNCPNLAITKVADASPVDAGDTVGYVITVTNNGGGTATNVTMTDTPLPSGGGLNWSIVGTPSGWTCAFTGSDPTRTLTCGGAGTSLGPSLSLSVHITSPTSSATCGTFNNSASVTTSNGTGSSVGPIAITVKCPNLSITKTADAGIVSGGDQIGYTITVTNAAAAGTAKGVTMTDILPPNAGLNWSVAGTTGGWTCNILSGTLTCGGGSFNLGPNTSATVHITSPTTSATCGTVSNIASATATNSVGTVTTSAAVITVNCQATLTVIKHVINNNGGTAVASDFTLDSGGTNDSPDNFAGSETGTVVTLDGGAFNVTETGPSGYTATYSTDCQGTIANGQSKTCTVTNDDQAAHLIVIKHVINDSGGSAVASDFTLDSGGTNDTPDNFAGAEAPGTNVTLDAGSFSVSETGPGGYEASFSSDCTGSIANGETKTCTITNNDQAATLTVIKHVINDNGGTNVAGDFTMSVTGNSPSPASFPGAEAGTTVVLNAGNYNVTELGPGGYSASFSTDCFGTIANGETKTCTITNNDQAAQLIVIKHVINDNGGTATAADFTLDSGGTNDSPDNFAGDEAGTTVTLDAGTYGVTETGPTGYTRSDSADCSGTIANGETKTCTITNDDQAATLVVIKHVINDNGGTNVAGDFTMSVTNNANPASFPGDEGGTSVGVNPGSYSVSEIGPSGYTQSNSADCTGTIALGQTKTCTVTNDDQAANLIVIKHVINDNGGTHTAADFTMY
jgi:uncharacterized repeat protein (TIGR01451 family)